MIMSTITHRPSAITLLILTITALNIFLSGCAATGSTTHTIGKYPPLCSSQSSAPSTLILWGTAWRTNQKEVLLREEIASRAIKSFFQKSACFSNIEVLKSINGIPAIGLSDVEVLDFASSGDKRYDKVILLRVEELGPLLVFYLSPILWEGGTEAVLRVRILNVESSTLESDISTHWRKSGPFVLKGTGTLEDDLQSALGSIFTSDKG